MNFGFQLIHPRRWLLRARRVAIAAVALGVPALGAPALASAQDSVAAGTRRVTLSEALRLARQNAPQTVAARGAVHANQAQVRAAYGAFLPSITANVGANRQFTGGTVTRINQNGERVTIQGNTWTYSNALSFNAQLLNLSNFPRLRAAQADVAAAQQNVVVQAYTVDLTVEQQFFAALASVEGEAAARTQLQQALEQLDASRRRVIAGAATASDSLRASTQVAAARLALATAQSNRRDANAALTRLVGSEVPLAASVDDPTVLAMDTVHVDSAAVVSRAVVSPTVSQAQAQLTAAHAQRQVARAAYLPTLSAGYSRGGSGLDSRFGFGGDQFAYSGQLNFSLSYPLFNQFQRESQVAQATVNENNAATSLRDARLQSRQLAVQYLDALQLGQLQVAVQTASIAAAQEDLRVQRQRYDLGLSTIVDVLTAQTTLNQARADLITARNTVRLAAARIESLIGQPLSTVAASRTGVTP